MDRRGNVERVLAVVGASALLIVGFDLLTYAATGSSLLLGRTNKAGATTTVQNTGRGPAMTLLTRSKGSAPFTTNARGLVPNLYAARAANSDKVGGLTVRQIRAGSIPAAEPARLVGAAGQPAFDTTDPQLEGYYSSTYPGFSPVSFRKDQLGVSTSAAWPAR